MDIKKFISSIILLSQLYATNINFRGKNYETKIKDNLCIIKTTEQDLGLIKNNLDEILQIAITAHYAEKFCEEFDEVKYELGKNAIINAFLASSPYVTNIPYLIKSVKEITFYFFSFQFKEAYKTLEEIIENYVGKPFKEVIIDEKSYVLALVGSIAKACDALYNKIKKESINEYNYVEIRNGIKKLYPYIEPILELQRNYPSIKHYELEDIVEKNPDEVRERIVKKIEGNPIFINFKNKVEKRKEDINHYLNKDYKIKIEKENQEKRNQQPRLPW